MKLFNIVLAGAAFLFAIQANAQMSTKSNTKENPKNIASDAVMSKIYGEITLSEINSRTSVKVSFDPIMERMVGSEKGAIAVVHHLKEYRFSSLGQALNILSSHGWNVEMVWTSLGRTGEVQRFLISHNVNKLSPVSPWLDKGSRGSPSKPNSKGGRN
tara:strand:- start:367 stop:840 length:474 start_codon:yes stop_codon:yes gene_type:complete